MHDELRRRAGHSPVAGDHLAGVVWQNESGNVFFGGGFARRKGKKRLLF